MIGVDKMFLELYYEHDFSYNSYVNNNYCLLIIDTCYIDIVYLSIVTVFINYKDSSTIV